tara:strand:+ start:113 stop:418 length:306 start_codon:yes stop_codon:yes gene_type:complete
MNYSQSANPDATNSELDAKVVVNNYQLNSSQKDKLIEQYVELVVDNMDTKTMMQYITDDLRCHFESVSLNELKDEVDNFDEQLYNELVENVLISELCEEVK